MDWLLDQEPAVIAAVAFVAGGVFNALIDLAGREISAYFAERRRASRELRSEWLRAIDLTQRWLYRYTHYIEAQAWGDDTVDYDAERYVGMRLELVGNIDLIRRMLSALDAVNARSAKEPATDEEIVELYTVLERTHDALAAQRDVILEGRRPTIVTDEDMNSLRPYGEWLRGELRRMPGVR